MLLYARQSHQVAQTAWVVCYQSQALQQLMDREIESRSRLARRLSISPISFSEIGNSPSLGRQYVKFPVGPILISWEVLPIFPRYSATYPSHLTEYVLTVTVPNVDHVLAFFAAS